MASPSATALSWVKQVPRSLFLLDKIPLVGEIPSMPLEKWAENLKNSLGLSHLAFKTEVLNWTEGKDFFEGIPNKKVFALSIPGIEGVFFFAAPSKSLSDLASSVLTGSQEPAKELDPQIEDGFVKFLVNEALYTLQKSGQPEKIMPMLLETVPPIPKDAGLVMDVMVTANEKPIPCRLIFSKEFQLGLSEEFKPNLQDQYLKSPLAEKIDIPVSFEAARLKMKPKEFQSITPGDFIVLDHCSIDPESKAGPILLKVFNLPFFGGQISDGKVTLAEVSQYYEADANMQSDDPEKNEPEDFELEGEELEEFEDDLQEFSDEELEELDHEKEEASHKMEEPEEEYAEGAPPIKPAETPKSAEEKPKEKAAPIAHEKSKSGKEVLSAGEVPLSLSVEIGRINISLNKLVQLASGNILEINSPDEGVDLVLNGKKVAQGELLKIGDVLGIRITDIGH